MAVELRPVYVCDKCGWDWLPADRARKDSFPIWCPHCKSREWNRDKKKQKANDREVQERSDYISEEW